MNRARRKLEHIEHALSVEQERANGLDDIAFVHQSLPNIGINDVQLHTTVGELSLSSPLFINAMTGGGGQETMTINEQLAEVAKTCGLAMAVGSQMAALKEESERQTFTIVRRVNENGIIFGNIGSEATVDQAKRAVEMIEANALQIHLNVVQELVMPEGDRDFTGALQRMERIVRDVGVPVIVKEVGFGISKETARKLADIGVQYIDVGGFGGTNFARVENERRNDRLMYFNEWGISTAASIVEVTQTVPTASVLASGGIRTSVDAVKALALGAVAVGVARPFLKTLVEQGIDALIDEITAWHADFTRMMTALGAKTVNDLQRVPLVIFGETHHWLTERGLQTKLYSQR
ncbi:type 2 isopentenyl-diphosphate Delta-isomerase [Anoxybacteroides amylolyticum]|uniref:type 2 isopentenyl-diphosphate Delta-isomerase n=1 Tax=Anoxybacteroides amylolyticum TaxID=294699 RepID=UPI000832A482|nr:type 2 isopentenyl-diphosphate Delta-isomerase [Anoxybacillus amylolyticus]